MKNTIIGAMILCAIGAGTLSTSAQQTTTEKEVEREIKKAEKEIQNAAKEIQKANKEVKVSNIQIERSVKESMAKALKPIVVEGFPLRGTGAVTVTGFPMNINQNFDYVFKDLKDVKAKEVSQEISTSKSPDIYVDNTSRNIQVKIC